MARQRLHSHCCDKLTKGAMSIHAAPHGNAATDWLASNNQIKLIISWMIHEAYK